MLFRPIVELDVPSLPEDMAARMHNQFAKESLREAMQAHHRRNIRKHFSANARTRYGHAPRNPKYRAYKRRRWGRDVDLVKTGASKAGIVSAAPPVQIGGAASGGRKGLSGSYRLRFKWGGGTGAEKTRKVGVTTAVMLLELARWAPDESREAGEDFHNRYWRRVESWRGTRKRIRAPRR